MSIILTGFNNWAGDLVQKAQVKIIESPMAKAIPLYQRGIGNSNDFNYSRFDFGGNGNQKVDSTPIISHGQNILTGVHANMEAVTAKWVVVARAIGFTALEAMQAENLGFSQYENKKDSLLQLYQRDFSNVMATGVTSVGSTGLINNTLVTKSPTKSNTPWATATAKQKIDDVGELSSAVMVSSGGFMAPDTLLIGATNYGHLRTETVPNTSTPLIEFISSIYGISNIIPIPDALALVNGKQRMAMYTYDSALVRGSYADVGTYNWEPTIQGLAFSQPFMYGFGSPEIYDLSYISYRDFP